LNQALIDKVRLKRNTTEIIIDLDSTHSDTFGNQEGTNYNAHYQTNGYHPLVAFDGLTGDFLKAELRSGNVYTSNGVRDFLRPLLNHYSQQLPCTTILVRGDSGFATLIDAPKLKLLLIDLLKINKKILFNFYLWYDINKVKLFF